MTLDACHVSEAILQTNQPISRQEAIKTKLAPDLWYLTTFQYYGRLLWYKRLTRGLKPAQGELNAVHVIHDDLILATSNLKEHMKMIEEVMEVISKAVLTLNPKKCQFGCKITSFLGMIYGADRVQMWTRFMQNWSTRLCHMITKQKWIGQLLVYDAKHCRFCPQPLPKIVSL